jgi:preprotein translocase subunit SecA
VHNQQREDIYSIRTDGLHNETPRTVIFEMIEEELANRLDAADIGGKNGPVSSAIEGFVGWANSHFPISLRTIEFNGITDPEEAMKMVVSKIDKAYSMKETAEDRKALTHLERHLITNAVDNHWQEHLTEMDDLRGSISLRQYGQKDPLIEYKNEAYAYFGELMDNIRLQVCTSLFRSATNLIALENIKLMLARNARLQGPSSADGGAMQAAAGAQPPASGGQGGPPPGGREIQLPKVTIKRDLPKVGRNEPCPCGSGKKYKQCHGK